MFISKNNCPVPFDQQPINEYLALKDSLLFSWSLSSSKSFITGIALISLLLFTFFFLLSVIIFGTKNIINIFSLGLFLSNLIIFFLFIRLYLGWSYVVKRLFSATIFYEESGWYDGQVWIKTSNYLMQDRLIGKYQIMPFIARIKLTFCVICINFLLLYIFKLMY